MTKAPQSTPLDVSELQEAERAEHRVQQRLGLLDLVPKGAVCAELGVFTGLFSEQILRVTQPREFHLVDPWWLAHGAQFPDWGPYTANGRLSTQAAYNAAVYRTQSFAAVTKVSVHVGYSTDWLETVSDGYLDWVYVDSSHEEDATLEELHMISRKLKREGLITGDDWWPDPTSYHFGVFKAVHRFCAESEFEIIHCDRSAQWALRRRCW